MKHMLCLLLALLLLFAVLPAQAEGAAISAALPAEIAAFFSGARFNGCTITPNAYAAFEDTIGDSFAFAIVTSGSANTLYGFRRENGQWTYYLKTAAALPQQSGVFYLQNGKGTSFFDRIETRDTLEIGFRDAGNEEYWSFSAAFQVTSAGQWRLRYMHSYLNPSFFATVGEDHISYCDDVYRPQQTVEGVVETNLRYFDWSAFPKTAERARAKLTNPPALPASSQLIAQNVKLTGGQKFAVYSGPGEWYQRGASGKAAVSTNDWIQVFGVENGYILIQYAVSSSQMRFGYIPQSADASFRTELNFSYDTAVMLSTASLTDDPLYSCQPLCTLWAGQQVKWLAVMGDWVYVEADGGQGQPVRGFVPGSAVQRMLGTSQTVTGQFADYTASCQFTQLEDHAFSAVVDVQFNGSLATQNRVTGYQVYAHQLPVAAEGDENVVVQTADSVHLQFILTGFLPVGASILGLCPVRGSSAQQHPEETLMIHLNR